MHMIFGWPPNWEVLGAAFIEIVTLYVLIYAVLRFLQGTRGAGVLRGLVFFLVLALLVVVFFIQKLKLYRLEYLMGREVLTVLLLIAVLFQPEVRRLLLRLGERMGEVPLFGWLSHGEPAIAPEIVSAIFTLSERKIGALVVLEREAGLNMIIEGGTPMNAAISSELLITIFWPGSPLHDGAVILRGNRIAAAGCLLPLTEQAGLAKTLGTRHRAAIGITEESDALSIIVSEETQQVSVAHRGQLRVGLDRDELRRVLDETLSEAVPPAPAHTNA